MPECALHLADPYQAFSPQNESRTNIGQVLVNGSKSGIFNGLVRVETQPEVAIGRGDDRREAATAVLGHERRIAVASVAHLQKVVVARVVRLHVELVAEVEPNDVARLG